MSRFLSLALVAAILLPAAGRADKLDVIGDVEGQPLGQNAQRLLQALEFLGMPLPADQITAIKAAAEANDAKKVQELLDAHVVFAVNINPESRVKVGRGPAEPGLQQNGFTPVLIKVVNESTVKKALHISSPQSGARQKIDYAATVAEIKKRVDAGRITAREGELQIAAVNKEAETLKSRFLQTDMFTARPMTANLSGLKVEYGIALIYSSEAGKREATIAFDVGQGTQDLGFRGEVPVLFDVKPAIPVTFAIKDFDDKPTVGRFTFRDAQGRVYPPRPKRLGPDFFFQDQIYRADGGKTFLPPGEYTMTYGRGPEYKLIDRKVKITGDPATMEVKLERWINPMDYGFYSGDHHIHAAGCAHYTSPTEGVFADDMFLHVKGEGLNVGCNLTWGPCFEFQRQYFEPSAHKLSEPFCVLKYDIEVSGFGSQAMGHVCLLNLKDQTYPGSDGTKEKGWPKWTTPVMKWTKDQGGFTGYAHSASGLAMDRPQEVQTSARGILTWLDKNKDGKLDKNEAAAGVLPEGFAAVATSGDDLITMQELVASVTRVRNKLPNYAIPPMDGIGAQEICVTTAMGVCDFISAMDTQRVPEWNCWYHIMNCGFPLKASGETDFPCITGSRVGQGRVYVQMGKIDRIDYAKWCEGLAKGRSYVSDGYAHALDFRVNDQPMAGEVKLDQPGQVKVTAKVAFAANVALGTANGGVTPQGNKRTVEVIVNGQVADKIEVPADDQVHELQFNVPIERSSWVALRHFPQMHTNPVNVIVGGKPIRGSKKSALWCIGVIDQLWRVRGPGLPANERADARKTFDQALEMYRKIVDEAHDDTK